MRTMRLLIPRWYFLLLSAIGIAGATLLEYDVWKSTAELSPADSSYELLDSVPRIWTCVLVFIAALYACHRVVYFHPLWQRRLLDWIRTMPPHRGSWLLLGPVGLVWQDAILLAIPVGLGLRLGVNVAMYAAVSFLAAYSLMHSMTLLRSECAYTAYAASLLLAVALYFLWVPAVCLAICAATCVIVHYRVISNLALICSNDIKPFEIIAQILSGMSQPNQIQPNQRGLAAQMNRSGWPLGIIAPRMEWGGISKKVAFAVSVLAAAYACALIHVLLGSEDLSWDDVEVWRSATPIAVGVAILSTIRIGAYITYCAAPISLVGRVATGRLFIPSYDRAWLTPLAAPIVAFAATCGMLYASCSISFVWGLGLGVGLFHILYCGPSLKDWISTGHVRLRLFETSHAAILFRT